MDRWRNFLPHSPLPSPDTGTGESKRGRGASGLVKVTLIGHMTVLIEMDGLSLLTDPWFGPQTISEKLFAPRSLPPSFLPNDLPTIDAFLVSHAHMDHCDGISLKLASDRGFAVIGPESVTRKAKRLGISQMFTLSPGQSIRMKGLTIRAFHAEHPLSKDALCFIIQGSHTLFFSGDTRFTSALRRDLEPYDIDMAFLQAACAHYPILGDDGMSLAQAAEFARTIRPHWTIPIHLHCIGKWLDRSKRIRIGRGNSASIDQTIKEWALSLESEGLGVHVLEQGIAWAKGVN